MENTFQMNEIPETSEPIHTQPISDVPQPPVAPQNSFKTFSVLLAGLLLMIVVGVGAYNLGSQSSRSSADSKDMLVMVSPDPTTNPKACTEDARMCPDGSSVSRMPPNCEFAECPVVETIPNDWKKIDNTKLGFTFYHPSDLKVIISNQIAGNQQVLYELSRANSESTGDQATGVYLVSYYPQTTADTFFAQFDDSVYASTKRTQIFSNGLTTHIQRNIPEDGPGAGIETMLAITELKGGVLTFDLVSKGESRVQDAKNLESIVKTLLIN